MNDEYSEDDLNTMTVAQLREFAADRGITLKSNGSKDEVIATILAAGDDEPEPMSDAEQEMRAAKAAPGERVEIMVHAGGGPEGQDPVKVGLNGKMFLINRDQWVKVPKGVLGILDNAKQTVMEEAGTDADGAIKYRERTVRRYTFQTR
ncbi:SAP domain-containing protein [Thioalkalivibrio sp. ALE12]|uniref:SAP domain-containing protein n=1 Tax=Thioalkalivibrio sp. ALE12 TaxID=1158170 RepID=UPI00037B3BE9|nr:SAP domain-containing protein [Thioalkalivibrio sp. ALE12]